MREFSRAETHHGQEIQAPAPARYFIANHPTDALLIPLCQALISGILSGIFFGALASLFHVKASGWTVGAITGSAVSLLAWFSSQGFWRWTIQRLLSDTLNLGREQPPELEPERELPPAQAPIKLEIIQQNGRWSDEFKLPFPERLPLLAAGVLQGKQLAQAQWTGQGAPFTRNEFETVRTALLSAGLVRWRKDGAPAQGCDLSPAGRALFKRLASLPPLLEDEEREQ